MATTGKKLPCNTYEMENLGEDNSQIQDALQSLQLFRHKMKHSLPASATGQDQVQARPELGILLFDTALHSTMLREEAASEL